MGLLLSISVMSPPSLWHIVLYSLCSCSKCVMFVVFSSKRTCLPFSQAHMTHKMALMEGKKYHDFTTVTLLCAAVSPHFIRLIKINIWAKTVVCASLKIIVFCCCYKIIACGSLCHRVVDLGAEKKTGVSTEVEPTGQFKLSPLIRRASELQTRPTSRFMPQGP